jgi:hypothetical protein
MGVSRDDIGSDERQDRNNNHGPQITGASLLKKTVKYIGPTLAAAAVSSAIWLAPVAFGEKGIPQSEAAATAAPSPSPAPAPFETGTDPLVPANTGADPYVILPPGYQQAS